MKQYLDNLSKIMKDGIEHEDRTGVGRRSIFGTLDRYDLSDGTIPLVTTRKIFTRGLIEELLTFFIPGVYDNRKLTEKNVNIWNKWAVGAEHIADFAKKQSDGNEDLEKNIVHLLTEDKLGSIGPMYGAMWRNAPQDKVHALWPDVPMDELPSDKLKLYTEEYEELKFLSQGQQIPPFELFCKYKYYETVDQLNDLIRNLKHRPHSSRLVVTAHVPALVPFESISPQENVILERGALAACHVMFQCFVSPPKEPGGKKRLSLMLMMRSQDAPVGGPYNIAQYSILLCLLAHVSDMEAYEFIHVNGDHHVYLNQYEGVKEQLTREPYPAPTLWINPEKKDLFAMTIDDVRIENYQHHPEIKYEVAT